MSRESGLIGAMVMPFRWLWRGLTLLRNGFSNLVFLVLVLMVAGAILSGGDVRPVPSMGVLDIAPEGAVVDKPSYPESLSAMLTRDHRPELVLRDLVRALEIAAGDKNIRAVVLRLDYLTTIGLARSLELGAALEIFRQSGKPVIAYGDHYSQEQYLLATYADQVFMHPLGELDIRGFGYFDLFYKDALDKLDVRYHIFRVGKFKSAVEPMTRNDMSSEARGDHQRWLQDIWQTYVSTVAERRKLTPALIQQWADRPDAIVAAQGGDMAKAAQSLGLIDGLKNRQEMDAYLQDLAGQGRHQNADVAIPVEHYIARHVGSDAAIKAFSKNRIAVVTARGVLMDGFQPGADVGAENMLEILDEVAQDPAIKALVLRVDSPGGSVFASELVREALVGLREGGKPVVVSMSSMAASGGYWISLAADHIVASPATLTGSIGVYAAVPNVADAITRLGVHSDGVATAGMADAGLAERPMNPQFARLMQQSVEATYRRFLALVSTTRQVPLDQVEALASGRVWTGRQAVENGLADSLGFEKDAVRIAAEVAGVQHYDVQEMEEPLPPEVRIFRSLMAAQLQWGSDWRTLAPWLQPLIDKVTTASRWNDPRSLYSYCGACSGL